MLIHFAHHGIKTVPYVISAHIITMLTQMVHVSLLVISVKIGIRKLVIVPNVSLVMEIQLMENVLVLQLVKIQLEMGRIRNIVLNMGILMRNKVGLVNWRKGVKRCVRNVRILIS